MRLVSKKEIDPFPLYDITVEEDHCFELVMGIIAHNSLYPKAVVSGGTGIYYSANTIFIITKAQEKEGDTLAGWKFTINIEKSRYVKEKSKLPFTVTYNEGIRKHSAIFDLAVEAKYIIKATAQTWSQVDPDTGEISDPMKTKKIEADVAFLNRVLAHPEFKQFVKNKFMMTTLADDNGELGIDAEDLDDE